MRPVASCLVPRRPSGAAGEVGLLPGSVEAGQRLEGRLLGEQGLLGDLPEQTSKGQSGEKTNPQTTLRLNMSL